MIIYDEYGRRYEVSHAQPDAAAIYAGRALLWLCFGIFFATRYLARLLAHAVHVLRARRAARLAYHQAVLAEYDVPPARR